MAKFSEVSFDAESATVTIGTGLTWDQVYSRLEPLGVMVTGGRIVGVGRYLCHASTLLDFHGVVQRKNTHDLTCPLGFDL